MESSQQLSWRCRRTECRLALRSALPAMPEMVPVDPSPRITKARPRIVARLIGKLACAFQGSPALGQRPDCLDSPALVCESLHGILPAGWIGLSGRDCRQIVKSGPGANGVDRAGIASMLSDFSYLRALGSHAVKFGLCDSQNPTSTKTNNNQKSTKGTQASHVLCLLMPAVTPCRKITTKKRPRLGGR